MAAGPEPVKGSVVAEEEPLETVSASSHSEFTLTDQTQRLKLRLTFSVRIKLRLKSPWQLKLFRQSYARDGLPNNSGCEGVLCNKSMSIDGLLQQTLGISKVKFLVINPWQVLTEPWLQQSSRAPSCVLL